MEIIDPSGQQYGTPRRPQQEQPSGMFKLVTKLSGGKITGEKVQYVLLAVVIIIVFLSVFAYKETAPKKFQTTDEHERAEMESVRNNSIVKPKI